MQNSINFQLYFKNCFYWLYILVGVVGGLSTSFVIVWQFNYTVRNILIRYECEQNIVCVFSMNIVYSSDGSLQVRDLSDQDTILTTQQGSLLPLQSVTVYCFSYVLPNAFVLRKMVWMIGSFYECSHNLFRFEMICCMLRNYPTKNWKMFRKKLSIWIWNAKKSSYNSIISGEQLLIMCNLKV